MPAAVHVTGSSLQVPPGERGLSTLRIAADVVAERAPEVRSNDTGGAAADVPAAEVHVHVIEPVFAERSGWRELAAEASTDMLVATGAEARPAEILAYASPLAGGPPRIDEGQFVFRLRVAAAPSAAWLPPWSRKAARSRRSWWTRDSPGCRSR